MRKIKKNLHLRRRIDGENTAHFFEKLKKNFAKNNSHLRRRSDGAMRIFRNCDQNAPILRKKFAMRRIFAGESPAQIAVFSKNISHFRRRSDVENTAHFRKIQLLFIYLKFPTTRVSWDGRVV